MKNVGILCEGDLDIKSLEIIVSNYIGEKINVVPSIAYGTIYPKIDLAIQLFFDHPDSCDFAIFVGDTDGNRRKKKMILDKISEHLKNGNYKIATGFPEPSLEMWFIREEVAMKKIFGLPLDKGLPCIALHPKDQVRKLWEEEKDMNIKTLEERYLDIALNLDLKKLSRIDKSFRNFCDEINGVTGE